MSPGLCFRLLLGAVASLGSPLGAADEPSSADAIAGRVRQLGGDAFDRRAAASAALEAAGPAALDALDQATAEPDAELRRRAWLLIDAIEKRHYGGPVLVGGKRLPDWGPALGSRDPEERLAAW